MENNINIVAHLQKFIENKAKSCSIDFGCISHEYIYRMWGGQVPSEKIEKGLWEIRKGK